MVVDCRSNGFQKSGRIKNDKLTQRYDMIVVSETINLLSYLL